jgi:CcmD family protein
MDNLGYLFALYSIVWLVVFIYSFVMINNQKKLHKQIQALKELMKEKESGKES